jgi:hypothetical protein
MRTTSDLREYLDAIDLCYFEGQLDDLGVDIRWMRARERVPRVGQYVRDYKMIEIARPLANLEVPTCYVMGVIYHECLHVVLGPEHDHHSHTFRMLEGRFLQIVQVYEWERENAHKAWPPAPKGLR